MKCAACTKKMVKKSTDDRYLVCPKCQHEEIDKKEALILPKNFDFTKLEVLGMYRLNGQIHPNSYRTSRKIEVVLLQYGKQKLYIPADMSYNEFVDLHPDLVNEVVKNLPFCSYLRNKDKEEKLSTLHYNRTNKLLPNYTLANKKEKLYNIFTYKNRLKESKYHIVYTSGLGPNSEQAGEILYQKTTVIHPISHSFENYRFVAYKEDKVHYIVDTEGEQTTIRTNSIECVKEVSERYIVGYDIYEPRHDDDYSMFLLKVIRKSDDKIIYRDKDKRYQLLYRLIGDRYLVTQSYTDGVLDLLTGNRIANPFKNLITDFICDVTDTGFTNVKGRHPLSELPDLKWTTFDIKSFVHQFNGFIPEPYTMGNHALDGTGVSEQFRYKHLRFRDIDKGCFYVEDGYLIDILNSQKYDVSDEMLYWVKKNPQIIVMEQAPENKKRFSVLQALKEGKNINGLGLRYGSLSHGYNNKVVKTHFLKEEVIFSLSKTNDVLLTKEGNKLSFALITDVKGKKVTFETSNFENFEVVSIE